MSSWCIGLDLSLASSKASRLGVAACPLDWDGERRRIVFDQIEYSLIPQSDDERGQRLLFLAKAAIERSLNLCGGSWLGAIKCIVLEALPTHQAFGLVPLAELHGGVRILAAKYGIHLITGQLATIRKLFLGSLPQGKGLAKKVIEDTINSMPGWASVTKDQCHALVACNYGLSEMCVPCLSLSNSMDIRSHSAPSASTGATHSTADAVRNAKHDSPPKIQRSRREKSRPPRTSSKR